MEFAFSLLLPFLFLLILGLLIPILSLVLIHKHIKKHFKNRD